MPCLGRESTFMVGEQDGNRIYVTFKKREPRDRYGCLITQNKALQKLIESSHKYAQGIITIEGVHNTADAPEDIPQAEEHTHVDNSITVPDNSAHTVVTSEVTRVLDARELLMKPPYNVPMSRLRNMEQVLEEGERCGVRFTHLKHK